MSNHQCQHKFIAVGVTTLALASFGLGSAALASQDSAVSTPISSPTSLSTSPLSLISPVQAAAALTVTTSWDANSNRLIVSFPDPGYNGYVKFKITTPDGNFNPLDVTVYLNNSQIPVIFDSDGHSQPFKFFTGGVDPISLAFRVESNLPSADFALDTALTDESDQTIAHSDPIELVVTDGQVEAKPDNPTPAEPEDPEEEATSSATPALAAPSGALTHPSSTETPGCDHLKPIGTPDLFQIDSTDTTARLYWSPTLENRTNYVLSYGLTPGGNEYGVTVAAQDQTGVNSFLIEALASDTTYYFNLRAQNGCMPGDWSGSMTAKTTKTGLKEKVTSFYRYQ